MSRSAAKSRRKPQDGTSTPSKTPKPYPVRFERDGLPTAVLDATETAAYLNVSKEALYAMVRRGEVPHTRVGRGLRFRVQDLDAYLAERTTRTWKPRGGLKPRKGTPSSVRKRSLSNS